MENDTRGTGLGVWAEVRINTYAEQVSLIYKSLDKKKDPVLILNRFRVRDMTFHVFHPTWTRAMQESWSVQYTIGNSTALLFQIRDETRKIQVWLLTSQAYICESLAESLATMIFYFPFIGKGHYKHNDSV